MKEVDRLLLEAYMYGFNNELKVLSGEPRLVDFSSLELKAYKLGMAHAIAGDDVSSFDLLSEEEILMEIKG